MANTYAFEPSLKVAKQRLSLKQVGELLGIGESAVRARFKAGKLAGERDNQGKIWVHVEPSLQCPAKRRPDEGSLRDLVEVMKAQIAALTAERDALRPQAAEAVKVPLLEQQLRREQETVDRLLALLAGSAGHEPRPGLWDRLRSWARPAG